MRVEWIRDYRDRNSGEFGFSTGIYHNIGEAVDFRYFDFQIRGIGRLGFYWARR